MWLWTRQILGLLREADVQSQPLQAQTRAAHLHHSAAESLEQGDQRCLLGKAWGCVVGGLWLSVWRQPSLSCTGLKTQNTTCHSHRDSWTHPSSPPWGCAQRNTLWVNPRSRAPTLSECESSTLTFEAGRPWASCLVPLMQPPYL